MTKNPIVQKFLDGEMDAGGTIAALEAAIAERDALLQEAHKLVDSYCVSIKATGTEWKHSDICNRITAVLKEAQ